MDICVAFRHHKRDLDLDFVLKSGSDTSPVNFFSLEFLREAVLHERVLPGGPTWRIEEILAAFLALSYLG